MTATALFYIEEVGELVEEPFWILPLGSMSDSIVADVDGLSVSDQGLSLLWSLHQTSGDDIVQITFEDDNSSSDGVQEKA